MKVVANQKESQKSSSAYLVFETEMNKMKKKDFARVFLRIKILIVSIDTISGRWQFLS